jgi:hypothetical protein
MKAGMATIVFFCSAGVLGLLTGALVGGTVLQSHGGHGLAGLVSLFVGATVGAVVGVCGALYVVIGMQLRPSQLHRLTVVAVLGSCLIVLTIVLLNHWHQW